MTFRATPSRGGLIGLAGTAAGLLIAGGLITVIVRVGPGPEAVIWSIPLVVTAGATLLLGYWTWGYFTLRYHVSRDGLTLEWAGTKQIVPMDEITHLLAGRRMSSHIGPRWPGYAAGRARVEDEAFGQREVIVYATEPDQERLLVVTRALAYAISPADPDEFIEEFRRRRSLGVQQPLDEHTELSPWARIPLWRDAFSLRVLVVALSINGLAFALLAWHYPLLPEELALRFRYDPTVARPVPGATAPLAIAWRLPSIGLAVIALNGTLAAYLHGRAELPARLVLVGAAVVQAVLAAAIFRIV